jgi:L-rhamnose mutarotase
MLEAIEEAGIGNYTIFRRGLTLFGYFKTDDLRKAQEYLAGNEVNRRCGEWNAPITKGDIDPTTDFPYVLPLVWHTD